MLNASIPNAVLDCCLTSETIRVNDMPDNGRVGDLRQDGELVTAAKIPGVQGRYQGNPGEAQGAQGKPGVTKVGWPWFPPDGLLSRDRDTLGAVMER